MVCKDCSQEIGTGGNCGCVRCGCGSLRPPLGPCYGCQGREGRPYVQNEKGGRNAAQSQVQGRG